MRGVEQIPWIYDLVLATQERWFGLRRWRDWLGRGARGRVLDLGTGTGRNLPHLPLPEGAAAATSAVARQRSAVAPADGVIARIPES